MHNFGRIGAEEISGPELWAEATPKKTKPDRNDSSFLLKKYALSRGAVLFWCYAVFGGFRGPLGVLALIY